MGAVTPLKLDSTTNLPAQFGSSDYATPGAFNAQTGTTYTLALTDQLNGIQVTNASAITVTVPTNASVAFPIYCRIPIRQGGAGAITLSGAPGVTLNAPNGSATTGTGDGRVLEKVATNTWVIW